MFEVRLSAAAAKGLKKAPPPVARRIRTKLDELAVDPYKASNVKKLTGHPGYRTRVGNWRILYLIEKRALVIQVIEIGHRKGVYR